MRLGCSDTGPSQLKFEMLNAQTTAAFIAAQQLLQSINGENVQIGSTTYPCLPADLIMGNRVWEQGGATQMMNITLSILKTDLPTAPLTNTLATFRGLPLRVISTNDADIFWSVQLVQEKA
jgi:hypothetical protein